MRGFYIVEAISVTAGQIKGVDPYNNESQIVDIILADSEEDAIDVVQEDLKIMAMRIGMKKL